jgi:phage tail sheath gpL-like
MKLNARIVVKMFYPAITCTPRAIVSGVTVLVSQLTHTRLTTATDPLGATQFNSVCGPMGDTTHVRMYKSDKERLNELTAEDKAMSTKISKAIDALEREEA